MHPLESVVYFSAAAFAALLPVRWWAVNVLLLELIVFPLNGHCGFGVPGIPMSDNHYIHHARFSTNFGSSPLWDGKYELHDNSYRICLMVCCGFYSPHAHESHR